MSIFVFRSDKDRRQRACTGDRMGGKLPNDFGPWRRAYNEPVPSAVELSAAVRATIRAKGFVSLPTGRAHDGAPAASSHPYDEGKL